MRSCIRLFHDKGYRNKSRRHPEWQYRDNLPFVLLEWVLFLVAFEISPDALDFPYLVFLPDFLLFADFSVFPDFPGLDCNSHIPAVEGFLAFSRMLLLSGTPIVISRSSGQPCHSSRDDDQRRQPSSRMFSGHFSIHCADSLPSPHAP